ncbi:CaiB/BaiF CoA transferase family protein [Streptomyces sp. NPDC048527]|uniref:CaiB/BaiF CoA transferase family protein n=1 Tax=Streptomyces sp. NPDC048527 TaxID=3365568 RepID=UPI0037177F48
MSTPTGAGPLTGIRVIELGGIGPAPYCGMLLADQGAELIRLDPVAQHGRRSHYPVIQRGKKSVAVDLKSADGVAAVHRLVATADAVTEGFRPGVAERLGIGPDQLLSVNPRLVYGRMTGYGQEGPLAQAAGHDVNYLAATGVLHNTGPADGEPVIPLNLVGDMGGGGMLLAFGLTSALLSARTTGRGQVVDAAMVDGVVSQLAGLFGPIHRGQWTDGRHPANAYAGNAPWYAAYRCADGGHMAVGCVEPQFWAETLSVLGLGEEPLFARQHDVAAWPAMKSRMAEVFSARTRAEWAAAFEGRETCVSPVLGIAESARHPHHVARRTFVTTADGSLAPNAAPRFLGTPAPEPGVAAVVGEHTREVLGDAGLTRAELDALADRGVIA